MLVNANITSISQHWTGNHEASCAEFDDAPYYLTEYLNHNLTNTTTSEASLNYWSCPPSQRNFTRYQNSFRMPSTESGVTSASVGNMWHSFGQYNNYVRSGRLCMCQY